MESLTTQHEEADYNWYRKSMEQLGVQLIKIDKHFSFNAFAIDSALFFTLVRIFILDIPDNGWQTFLVHCLDMDLRASFKSYL
jgi:hypothetical protein